MQASNISSEGDRRQYRDFIVIRIQQHGQTLVCVASKYDLVKAVRFAVGNQGDTVIITLDELDRSIEVNRWEVLHHGPNIRSRAPLHSPPLRTASDGEHSMVLHEIQNELDGEVKECLA